MKPQSAVFPLAAFLQHLKLEGHAVDLRSMILLQRVLEGDAIPKDATTASMGDYLVPLIATNAEEQEKLLASWERFLATTEEILPPDEPDPNSKNFWHRIQTWFAQGKRKHLLWVIPILLVGMFFAWVHVWPLRISEMVFYHDKEGGALIGDTVKAWPRHPEGADKDLTYAWSVNDTLIGEFDTLRYPIKGNGYFHITLTAEKKRFWRKENREIGTRRIKVNCRDKPQWRLEGPDTLGEKRFLYRVVNQVPNPRLEFSFQWMLMSDGKNLITNTENLNCCEDRHEYSFTKEGKHSGVVIITSPSGCDTTIDFSIDLSQPDTTPKIASLPEAPLWRHQYTQVQGYKLPWLIGFFGLLGIAAIGIILFLRQRRIRKEKEQSADFATRFASDPHGPYEIPWPNQNGLIAWHNDLDAVAALMAGRSHSERLYLDVPASIRATSAAAGMPDLRYKGRTEAIHWLILLDEASLNKQEIALFEWFIQQLRSEAVLLDSLRYRGNIDLVYRQGETKKLSLRNLRGQFGGHRLILISRGAGLLHPLRNEVLPTLKESLHGFAHRTLLTPQPFTAWGSKEKALSEVFGLCPVDSKAMRAYFLLPSVPVAEDFGGWRKQLARMSDAVPADMPERIRSFAELKNALGGGFLGRWVRVLHTYAEPVWPLILGMGHALKARMDPQQSSRLVWDELWALLRLPILRAGKYDSAMRQEAKETQPDDDLQRGREILIDLMQEAEGTLKAQNQKGMAGTKLAREIVQAQYANDRDNPQLQAAMRALVAAQVIAEPVLPLKPVQGRRKYYVWWMGFVAVLLGLMTFVLSASRNEVVNGYAPTAWEYVDTLPTPDAYGEQWDRVVAKYNEGKQAYEAGKYADAIVRFREGQDLRERDTLTYPDNFWTDSLNLLHGDLGAKFRNGMGLSHYYAKAQDSAIFYYLQLVRRTRDFFQRIVTDRPNLETLLKAEKAVRGVVTDTKGRPLYGAAVSTKMVGTWVILDSTDENGNFEIPSGFFSDTAFVFITLPNYEPWAGKFVNHSNPKVVLAQDDNGCAQKFILNGNITMPSNYRILGGKAQVAIPGVPLQSFDNGAFQMELCGYEAGGRVKVYLTRPGYAPLDTFLDLVNGRTYLFPMRGEVVLSGEVAGEDGAILQNYKLSIGSRLAVDASKIAMPRFEVHQKLALNGAPQYKIPSTAKLKIEAEGYEALETDVELGSEFLRFELKKKGPPPPDKPWSVTVLNENKKPVPSFELFVEGVSIAEANAKDNGKLRIPREALNGDGGRVKITAQGFEVFETTLNTFTVNTFTLPRTPQGEIEKLMNDMVPVPGGSFVMGDDSSKNEDEQPAHAVSFGDFEIGKFEVTQAQWRAVMGENPSTFNDCPQCPVERVSWTDCQKFIQKLNEGTKMNFRLPTEAEWEYAARGGNKSKGYRYAGSNDLEKVAWFTENSDAKTHPVGQNDLNELGLHDMSGNVWEWCQDWYDENYYKNSPSQNPKGPKTGNSVVLRGGCWSGDAEDCRVSSRLGHVAPVSHNFGMGFRLARD